MTYEEFLIEGKKTVNKRHKALRVGQAWFNYLAWVNVELAEKINNTEFDPFFDDKKIEAFKSYLKENWK